ncbi:LysR family transcriptional regulator [Chelativorans salis]|uniref:LysR family transcriptional regulator n=1 Tax=Chelativorans salis TaxID=2978478 RepID=A0ABT2LTF1_9HYPH|nr:LysR family transcriptional regulator [Chelativorans sp. EGI FJ00035]MCT7377812.1 LysR family transcriptional regulator [Chelativorans sp. EGI FJ00035]
MDRLTALKVFRHVVELGSFAEAARQLRLSPAAISKNVGELEANLAVRLLNRTTRRMSLTEAGSLYYDQVARILDELEEADSSLGPLQESPSGLLRVSAPVTLTLVCLSKALPGFLDRYLNLTLDLRLDDRRVNIVEEGFDIAIRASSSLEDSSLIARRLTTIPHVVCGAPSYLERSGTPARPEDLTHHSCIQFTLSGHANEWTFEKAGRQIRVPITGRYKVTSSLAVRDALRAGFGLSLIPWSYVREDVEQGRLRTVLDEWSAVALSVYAVYPSRRHVVPKVRAFLDFLVEELGEGVNL